MESAQYNRVDQGSTFYRPQNKLHLYWNDSLGPALLGPGDLCGLYLLQQHQWYLLENKSLRSTLSVITSFTSSSTSIHIRMSLLTCIIWKRSVVDIHNLLPPLQYPYPLQLQPLRVDMLFTTLRNHANCYDPVTRLHYHWHMCCDRPLQR